MLIKDYKFEIEIDEMGGNGNNINYIEELEEVANDNEL